ncbi:MFS transporter [Erythrobacter sp. EC-HK427]|uniref:MFS transporter n=1 Tax=Erythrobacter sp. EC-HK427 TaxID=2038396 RepID=UPI0012532B68|nr:MFS transporter [Erythrobacter sp. EC-HK427]VVT06789.1 Membrane protein [Erythrobacter sp. EC-HK427]
MPDATPADRIASQQSQSPRFLLLYALAVAGGAIAYVPFLTILLPVRVEALAGDASVDWLAYAAMAGALAASFANIGFGWASDLTRALPWGRRGWIATGLMVSSLLLANMSVVTHLPVLIAMLVAWQFALNMMLAPLAAWAGDTVPDHQKGLLGGLLASAPAMGALVGALITIPGLASPDTRLILVAVLVILCVAPALLFGKPAGFPELVDPVASTAVRRPSQKRGVVVRMWLARLLVQIAEAALFAYLYLWLRSIAPGFSDNEAAQIFFGVLLVTVPVALWVGRWADRVDRPIFPLTIAAGVAAAALLSMAIAPNLVMALAAYAVFGLSAHVFLSLHSAQTLRVLPRPERRGRDLGLFNLTNTVPSPIMSVLTLTLVPVFGFDGLFVLLSGLASLACLCLLSAGRIRHHGK